MTEPQLRLTPPPSAADLAKRLRTITAGMTAAQHAGLARPRPQRHRRPTGTTRGAHMTKQQTITVEKIEHHAGSAFPWAVRLDLPGLGEVYLSDEEFATTGLRYEPTIPITIGEQTGALTRGEAERIVAVWDGTEPADEYDRAMCKVAALLRAHLEAEQHG